MIDLKKHKTTSEPANEYGYKVARSFQVAACFGDRVFEEGVLKDIQELCAQAFDAGRKYAQQEKQQPID